MTSDSLAPAHQRVSPTVVAIHPDETLLDTLQYVLEQRGVRTTTLIPDPARGLTALAPYLLSSLRVCVYGLCPPYPAALALLTDFTDRYPDCGVVLTAPDPVAALRNWRGRVYPLVPEGPDLDQAVTAIVATVSGLIERLPAAPAPGRDGDRPEAETR